MRWMDRSNVREVKKPVSDNQISNGSVKTTDNKNKSCLC